MRTIDEIIDGLGPQLDGKPRVELLLDDAHMASAVGYLVYMRSPFVYNGMDRAADGEYYHKLLVTQAVWEGDMCEYFSSWRGIELSSEVDA